MKIQDSRFKIQGNAARLASGFLLPAFCFLLFACGPTPTPPPPGLGPTAFVQTRVAQLLTESAAEGIATAQAQPTLATATPRPPEPTATPTHTHTPAPTPTATPTPTEAPTSRATESLSTFPLPPTTFVGDAHFYFGAPLAEGYAAFVSSRYRYGSLGVNQLFAPHHGVDLSGEAGTPIAAVAAGVIYYAGSDAEINFGPQSNFYGNVVVLQLAQPWNGHAVFALYGHMDTVAVTSGQSVNAGDVLGTVGATGVALGPHPHLEVRLDFPESYWDTRNPELWLTPNSGYGALAVRVTNANGRYLPGVRVNFLCADGAPRWLDTYWYNGVNPDDVYGENAAMTNVPAGYCQFTAEVAGETLTAEATIAAGEINFVWLR